MFKSQNITWILGVILVVLIIAGGLLILRMDNQRALELERAQDQESSNMAGDGTQTRATSTDDGADNMAEARTIMITGRNFAFSEDEIRVTKGERINIVFSSTDGFHDWTIDEFAAQTERVTTGNTAEVEFVADKTGTFEYYCSVGNHRALGMSGMLIVEE